MSNYILWIQENICAACVSYRYVTHVIDILFVAENICVIYKLVTFICNLSSFLDKHKHKCDRIIETSHTAAVCCHLQGDTRTGFYSFLTTARNIHWIIPFPETISFQDRWAHGISIFPAVSLVVQMLRVVVAILICYLLLTSIGFPFLTLSLLQL